MISVRSSLAAGALILALSAAGAAQAECRGGAVSGIPACTGGGSDSYYSGEPTALGVWIQEGIARRDARAAQYNRLLADMRAAQQGGRVDEFNRLGAKARAIYDRRDLRRWIDEVNFYHKANLAHAAAKAGRYAEALQYIAQVRDIMPSREQKWYRDFVRWNEAGALLVRADNVSLSRRERVALYDQAMKVDPKVLDKEGRAFVEWVRAGALADAGKTREALKAYRSALPMQGNDTAYNRSVIAGLEQKLAAERARPDVVRLNPTSGTRAAQEATAAKARGDPAKAKTARGQLDNATGGTQALGQTFDGGGGLEPVPQASLYQPEAIQVMRIFSPTELERYNASPAFRSANLQVEEAAKRGEEARARRAALSQQQAQAADAQRRAQIQVEVQKAEQELSLRRGEQRAAELARDNAIREVEGKPIFVD